MSCSNIDLKGYFLEEIPPAERQAVERHLAACEECRQELERLELTRTALLSVREEPVPQRIAFVSDKVLEPPWWQRFWQSAPRLAFASAAMLSVAILVHAFTRPAPAPAPALDRAEIRQIVDQQVAARLDAAVSQALAAAEQRHREETARLLAAAEQRFELQRRADMITIQENFEYLLKRVNVLQVASVYREGEP